MTIEPRIEERAEQPYAAIKSSVTMPQIATTLPPLHGEVFAWLGDRGIEPAGTPFWKYNVIDMEPDLEIEVAVPIAKAAGGDDRVFCAVLPAGRYATLTHIGHPRELIDVTDRLLKWGKANNLGWDVSRTADGERWGARLEIYETDPDEEPDMDKWETTLAFRLAG